MFKRYFDAVLNPAIKDLPASRAFAGC